MSGEHVAQLRAATRVVTVQPWMVAELGIAAVWFSQLLWRMEQADTYEITAADHEWEVETGLSRTQVHRARSKVAERGWIECRVRKVAGAPTTTIVLHVDALDGHLRAMHRAISRDPGSRDSAQSFPLEGDLDPEGVTPQQQRAIDDERRAAAFVEFWTLYPRSQSKAAAQRAWPKAVERAGGVEPIIEGARRWADAARAAAPDRRRFIPHGSTWLNGDRWDDDPLDALGVPVTGAHGRIITDRTPGVRRLQP